MRSIPAGFTHRMGYKMTRTSSSVSNAKRMLHGSERYWVGPFAAIDSRERIRTVGETRKGPRFSNAFHPVQSIRMDTVKLLNRWSELCRRLGIHADCTEAGREVLQRYSEPHRRYHNCNHLADCLRILDSHIKEANDPLVVETALWFHDVIYIVGAKDNEERSANLARQLLDPLGVSAEFVNSVRAAILATKHQTAPPTGDARLVCDIDLSILGASPDRYTLYAEAIFAESRLSPDTFNPLRRAFLKAMLSRPRVFHTTIFRDEFEATARQNMSREYDDLSASR